MKKLFYVLVVLSMLLAFNVSAFDFAGYAYNVTKGPINNTNVSLLAYNMDQMNGSPTPVHINWTMTNASGFFNLSMPDNDSWNYKPVLRHFLDSNVDYIGPSLSQLPFDQIQRISPIDFYLKEGATINITAQGREQASGSVNELGSWDANDYLLGLEWDNDTQLWVYVNTTGFLVKLNPDFLFNTSYNITMPNFRDVEYVSSGFWYFANSTTVLKYYENVTVGNLTLEEEFPITCDGGGPCNYTTLSSLEYDGNNTFYVMAVANGNTTVDKFNMSFARQNSVTMPDYTPGKLAFSNGNWFLGFNNSNQYRIEPCYLRNGGNGFDCKMDEYWNVSGSIEGLENNGTGAAGWFYGSTEPTPNNITQIELLYTTEKTFRYMVKDVKLGYPIAEEFDSSVSQATIYVSADRNYSIMLYPDMSFPVSYDLNNISDYPTPKHVDIMFNTTEQWRWVSGYALQGGSADFDEFNIIAYLIEPGNMIGQGHPLPYNMSAWRETPTTDVFNSITGFYNITLPGAMMTTDIMLFAVAKSGSNYYGAFRNISLNFSDASVADFNFTLYTLPGTESVITLQGNEDKNITVKKVSVQVNNESGGPISDNAFTETIVDYTSIGGPSFSWMQDVNNDQDNDNGIFMIPLLANAGVEKMNIYSKNNAPKKTSFTAEEVATGALEVNLSSQFQPKNPEGEEFMDLFIDMIKSTAECDVPDYNMSACSLFPPQGDENNMSEKNMSSFDPFKIVMGGGKISFVMRKASNNITVHYKNVDMMASGPPDALFDENASSSAEGSSLDMAWRFGSQGPEIYDEVLIGIPLGDEVDLSAPVIILLQNLYDEDWNAIWNIDLNGTPNSSTDLPSDYEDFNLSWFNQSSGGMPCSNTTNTDECYIDANRRLAWLQIPHFSGIGPSIQSVSLGGVNITADDDEYDCTESCAVYFNVTNENYTLSQSLHNITIETLDVNGSLIANVSIYWYNSSAFVLNGTNSSNQTDYNLTLSNGSASTLHQYRLNVTKLANQSTTLNITYNLTGLNLSLGLSLALNCVEEWTCTDWSTCSGGSQSKTCTEGHSCGTTAVRPDLTQDCSSGSSGGGGGSAIPSTTNPSASRMWDAIPANALQVIDITNAQLGLTKVSFTLGRETKNAKLLIELLSEKPANITAPGEVYKYLRFTATNITDDMFSGIVSVKLRISKAWLSSKGLNSADMVLKRYRDDEWLELATRKLTEDDSYVYYESDVPGFSYFAIAKKTSVPKAISVPEAVPVEEPVEQETPPIEASPAEEVEESPLKESFRANLKVVKYGLIGLGGLLVIALIVLLVLMSMRWYKRKKAEPSIRLYDHPEEHEPEHGHEHSSEHHREHHHSSHRK